MVERSEYDQAGKRLRPDLQIVLMDMNALLDVSVACPSAPSHARDAARQAGAAAKKREKEKTKKYEALARAEGKSFVPLVVETYGRLGQRAEELLQLLAHASVSPAATAHQNEQDQEQVFFKHSVAALSVILQRGNAHVNISGCHNVLLNPRIAGERVGRAYRWRDNA